MTDTLTVHIPSQSDPALTYTLHAHGDEITCSCRGYNSHQRCKHATALKAVLAEGDTVTTDLVKQDAPPLPIVAERPPTALLPTSGDLNAMTLIATKAIGAKGMIPKNIETPEQALAVMLAGWELGLRPMTALRHVYVVNGKTELETRAMVGIIRARDPQIKFSWPVYTREKVTCIIARPGNPLTEVTYTVEDAKASGQYKPGVWTQYTRDMLYAAATKRACRLACPDLINAIESGLQHTVSEAESYMAPPAEVRVVDALDVQTSDIPQDAYNDGDDAISAEVEAEIVDYRKRIKDLVLEAKDQWDADSFKALGDRIRERYPVLMNKTGALAVKDIDDDLAREIADWLTADIHPETQAALV